MLSTVLSTFCSTFSIWSLRIFKVASGLPGLGPQELKVKIIDENQFLIMLNKTS